MSSVLYKKPYERGLEEGEVKCRKQDVIILLTKKFGELSKDVTDKITTADPSKLGLVVNNIFDIVHLEDAIKLLNLSDIASITKNK